MRYLSGYLWVSLLALVLVGCAGLPADLKQSAEGCPARLKREQDAVAKARADLTTLKTSPEWHTFLHRYADREKWEETLSKAKNELVSAEKLYAEKIQPLVHTNKFADKQSLTAALNSFTQHVTGAEGLVKLPEQRIHRLREARAHGPEWVKQAGEVVANDVASCEALALTVKSAQEMYPLKKEDIAKRFASIDGHRTHAEKSLRSAQEELARHSVYVQVSSNRGEAESTSTLPDYAVMADECDAVGKHAEELKKLSTELHKKLGELSRSYSKILTDMKADFFVVVLRTSWNENYDWPTETERAYTKPISQEGYVYLCGFAEDHILATLTTGWTGSITVTPAIDKAHWNALGISPEEGWPKGDNMAEFSLDDVYGKFYHQYTIEENGVTKTVLEEVNEEKFEDHIDDLGMAIVSKPVGLYEEDVITEAAPPGLAYVGNPHYGEWQKDANGNSFWAFYGRYHFYRNVFGYPSYTRTDWDTWNQSYRNQKPYYGGSASPIYGSSSKAAQATFAGSSYGKQGGFKTGFASIRGAGPAARGGGPGGGGK